MVVPKKKKILFVTGTRADFSKIKEVSKMLIERGWDVSFFVTGMHMLEAYGATYLEVRRIAGAKTYEYVNQRCGDPLDIIYAKTVLGFSDWLCEHKPDLVVVHGDRVEAKACAFVCSTNYVRCLHIEGGEVSGTIDEVFRHCVSKLAHHHFVCSETAQRNVVSLGEDISRVLLIGSPELDVHGRNLGISLEEVLLHYEIPFSDFGIVTFHPVTSEQETIGSQARALFRELEISGKNFVVISSNNDPGSEEIMKALEELNSVRFKSISSMRFEFFSVLMKHAACIIGNSSAGVREAPFLGVPSLNIGTRQTGRGQSQSITHASAFDSEKIEAFLTGEWSRQYAGNTEFGDGKSVARFCDALDCAEFWLIPKQKYFQGSSERKRLPA
ncbi:UDP-N-acetylglucosamine 2-epimerase [Pseudovibrio ascidiaceicola]|uniref:UDP-N-acetylglucosamine 2-epimerase n=1 Tax=Pseudovibrio ascidiaceicola TaxID=285279 RepID=UPI000D687829|nr:UDP-N-acetylglucosamine 2-epimerase [Pseudovibrio ascidiaceicola]